MTYEEAADDIGFSGPGAVALAEVASGGATLVERTPTEALKLVSKIPSVVPPLSVLPAVTSALAEAVKAIPEGRKGALVFLTTGDGTSDLQSRAAIVHRLGDDFAVAAWVGKDWGKAGVPWGVGGSLTW